jgi:perosamine synthetase
MKIPLFKTYSDEDDVKAVSEVIKRGTFWAIGPEIEEFEKKIANYIGVKYALAFNSGTSALHTLLLAYEIKGKEVIVPSFTFIATANAVILAGGKPVFAEVETDTFGLDYEDVKKRITPNTIAIMPIHYGGFPARDIENLKKLAEENNILLIEDAAQSIGSTVREKKVGSFGDSAIFSFCQNKILTTGEGGVILTNSEKIYNKAKFLRSHGRVELEKDYFSSTEDNDYIEPGYNFRMSSMTAALGLSQFEKINELINLRREKAKYLSNNLSKIKEINLLKELENNFQVYQMYTIKLESEKIRNNLQKYLMGKGIMSKVYFNPVHLKSLYKSECGFKEGDLPVTEELSSKILTLPFYPRISFNELDYIINSINEFFKGEKNE